MIELLIGIGIWLFLWILFWGVFVYGLQNRGIDYIHKYGLTATYFIFVSSLMIYLFRDYILHLIKDFTIVPFIFLILMFVFKIATYNFSNRYIVRPRKIVNIIKEHHIQFLAMKYKHIISKSAEIFFQQVLIILLVVFLASHGFNLLQIIIIFSVIFSFAHIYCLKIDGFGFGLLFLISASISSIVFPTLILKVNYGFVYSYIIHNLFYSVTGIVLWIHYGHRKAISIKRPKKKIVKKSIKKVKKKKSSKK